MTTEPNTRAEREAFESAMVQDGYQLDYLRLHGSQRYAYMETEWAYRGWEVGRASRAQAEQDEAAYASRDLAKMVLSDCGISYDFTPLLNRVAGRIDRHVERMLNAVRADADRAQAAQAVPEGWIEGLKAIDIFARFIHRTLDSEDYMAENVPGLKDGPLYDAGERAVFIQNKVKELLVAAPSAPPASEAPAVVGLPERDASKSADQQGLFREFEVRRVDGSDAPGGKHHGCRYFVLDVDHDEHARAALTAYAASCEASHPELAADLREKWGAAPTTQAAPQPAAPQDRPVTWEAFHKAVDEYIDQYEMIGETEDGLDACYTPNENDRALLLDAFMGFDFTPWVGLATQPQEAAPAAVPEGWVPCMIDYEGGYPEEVAFGPQIMMDRLKKWLTSYFAMLAAHPAEGVPALDDRELEDLAHGANQEALSYGVSLDPFLKLAKAVRDRMARGVPAQGDAQKERDDAFEAVRKQLCKLPKYSFALDSRGNIRRWNDRSGNWIEFNAAHGLFDPVAIDAAIAQAKESGS